MSSGTSASITETNTNPSELRIVLIGGRDGYDPSGKSSVGNIILGRDVFETNRRTVKSEVGQELVCGRQITVVDTPGWVSYLPLDLTPKLTQLEIQKSAYLCPPGPHGFVLVMPLDDTYVGTGMSVEEHVSFLLNDHVWRHTIVVFTVADKNKMRPAKNLISCDPSLRSLIKKCEDRFHVLNITDKGDGSQVTELLEKIEQMVTSNGGHYEVSEGDGHLGVHHLKDMDRQSTIKSRAKERMAEAQTTRLPKADGLSDVRVLMLGGSWSGKSSTGNTILGKSVFKGNQRSGHCEVKGGEVGGKHLTVVDSPGWFYNSRIKDTSEMDKLEIRKSLSLCSTGPHSVLLMVPLCQAFTKAHKAAIMDHMKLLTRSVWSHTIVLFTHGDWLGDISIEQHIETEGEDLRWLVDKCGNRYHVFNNKKRDDTQVTELLQKIEVMVAGNRSGHFEVDGGVSEKDIDEHVQTFMSRTRKQRAALKALFEGEHQSLPDVRVMLVGGEKSEKSRAGNQILQDIVFTETPYKEFKTKTNLTESVRQQRNVAERNVSVVNCPDWSTRPSKKIKDDFQQGVTLCSPGPHAVLLTVSVRSSFSEADRKSVEKHMERLGDRVWRHTLVLFTRGSWLGERRVEEYIVSEGEPLKWLLEKCGYRYHVLHCGKWDISEVTELMEKIEDMVTRNRGHFGPLDSREDGPVRDAGHSKVGVETRQMKMTLFQRLKGEEAYTAEDWKKREDGWKKGEEEWKKKEDEWRRREEEMIDTMLKIVGTEPEEPAAKIVGTEPEEPAAKRRKRSSIQAYPPSMDGEAKVSDWLLKTNPGPTESSSAYGTMSEAPTLTVT